MRISDDRLVLGALLAAFALLYAWGLGRPELINIDECRSGVIVRDIVEGGRWLLPRTPDGFLSEKPPAYYHPCAVASLIFGTNEWTLRGVSVVMALATLAVMWFWAALYGSARVAALAVVALGTNVHFAMWARTAMVDMSFTFFITAGLAVYFAARLGRLRPRPAAVFCGVALGFAVLSKGPLGLLLPLAAMAGDILVRTRGRFWRAPVPWGPTASAAGLIVGISLLWYLPGYLAGGREFLDTCLLDENFYMPLGLQHGIAGSHVKSPLYYPSRQFLGVIPLVAFLPETVQWLFRRDSGPSRAHAAAWLGFGFLVLMAASNKRVHYLLPLQPAAALMVAMAVGRCMDSGPTPALRWGTRLSGTLLALGGVIAIGVTLPGPGRAALARLEDTAEFLSGAEGVLVLVGILLLAIGIAQLATAGRGALPLIRAVALGGLFTVAFRSVVYDGLRGAQDDFKPFVAQAKSFAPAGARVAVWPPILGYAVYFYWPERLTNDPTASETADFFFTSESKASELGKTFEVLGTVRFSRDRKGIVFVRGRPTPR